MQEKTGDEMPTEFELELELEESNVYFQPEAGNVIFGSSLDGWGFTIADFARIYAERTKMNRLVLEQTLWGDFYLDSKAKRIFKGAANKKKPPLFVSMILQQIWSIYESIVILKEKEKTEKIVKSLNLTIAPRDLRHQDPKVHVQAVMSQWLPLAKTVLTRIL